MKKMISLILATAVIFNAVKAQEAQDAEKKGKPKKEFKNEQKGKKEGKGLGSAEGVNGKGELKNRAKKAFDKVGLSAEQQTKAALSMRKTRESLQEVKNSGATKEEKKEKVKSIKEASSKELEAIMGKDKFEAWKKEMKATRPKKENDKGKGKANTSEKMEDDEDEN